MVETNRHADAATLHGLDQGTEVAVAGEQNDLVDVLGKLHRINHELDVHIALHLAAAAGVHVFLGQVGDNAVIVILEPIEVRPRHRIFEILDRRVIERPQQRATALKHPEQAVVVDVEAERLRGCAEVGAIDKERDLAER